MSEFVKSPVAVFRSLSVGLFILGVVLVIFFSAFAAIPGLLAGLFLILKG